MTKPKLVDVFSGAANAFTLFALTMAIGYSGQPEGSWPNIETLNTDPQAILQDLGYDSFKTSVYPAGSGLIKPICEGIRDQQMDAILDDSSYATAPPPSRVYSEALREDSKTRFALRQTDIALSYLEKSPGGYDINFALSTIEESRRVIISSNFGRLGRTDLPSVRGLIEMKNTHGTEAFVQAIKEELTNIQDILSLHQARIERVRTTEQAERDAPQRERAHKINTIQENFEACSQKAAKRDEAQETAIQTAVDNAEENLRRRTQPVTAAIAWVKSTAQKFQL